MRIRKKRSEKEKERLQQNGEKKRADGEPHRMKISYFEFVNQIQVRVADVNVLVVAADGQQRAVGGILDARHHFILANTLGDQRLGGVMHQCYLHKDSYTNTSNIHVYINTNIKEVFL